MKRARIQIAAAALAWLMAAAFDTQVDSEVAWHSIYQTGPTNSVAEHTVISDDTFDYLDPSGQLRAIFGRNGAASLEIVDLNASYFREPLLLGLDPVGDNPDTEAEERTLPPPAMFAGLPDYSYALYDWINKNRTCPAFDRPQYADRCHEFMGWLGALNSVHFGTQASDMYAHLHENAIELARRARAMREAMTEEEQAAYLEEIQEAELLALAYEGYAQHFLQDRWAIGHMWERWDSPDTSQEDADLVGHLAIGALSGIIHGAEAVVTQMPALEFLLMRADPLSSPLPGPSGAAQPMMYRHVRSGGMSDPIPGIGDERYADAIAGTFSLSRYDPASRDQTLNVAVQLAGLRRCAGAGWTEVIRELGTGPNGGYGIYDAPLSPAAPTFRVVEEGDCWNMWATNESMMTGLLGPNPGRAVALLGVVDFVLPETPEIGSSDNNVVAGDRGELVAYATRLWLYGRNNPIGTEVAQGQMTSLTGTLGAAVGWGREFDPNTLWGFEHGGHYDLPDYVVPIGLSDESDGQIVPPLDGNDIRGRDTETLYGFFNGAFSDHWCENREILRELRDDPTPRNRELCEQIAGRIYQGTHPSYQGGQSREREYDGAPVRSICSIRNTSGVESESADDRDNPYWLDQGYVPYSGDTQTIEPVNTDSEAVANWCARTPVLDLFEMPERRDANIAALVDRDDNMLEMAGRDLGEREGLLFAVDPVTGLIIQLDSILSWSDTRIEADISGADLETDRDYRIILRPAADPASFDRVEMPGLYHFRIEETPEFEVVRLDLGGASACGETVPDFEIVDMGAFFEAGGSPSALPEWADRYAEDVAPLRDWLDAEAACMRDLRTRGLPVMRAAQDNVISYVVARQGRYYTLSPVRPALAVSTLIGPDSDYYSTYITQVETLSDWLGRAENVVRAWALAYSADTPYQRNSLDTRDLLAAARSPEAALAAGFSEIQMPAGVSDPAERARILDMMRRPTAFMVNFELSAIGNDTLEGSRNTLAGLPAWTQVQHTLVRSALPDLDAAIAGLRAQTAASLDEFLSEAEQVYCDEQPDGTCNVLDAAPYLDTRTYDAVSHSIGEMLGGPLGDIGIAMPALNIHTNMGGSGLGEFFRVWPRPESMQAAARYSVASSGPALETRRE
ncbi:MULTISPECIES: hypothetical protein [Hyphobacterium]|uniref:Uncharacterized protein n=1 Tax=Hyphobacterium vulgare TaxID=1736751 RepID=A0ABV6ZVR3_9PROT